MLFHRQNMVYLYFISPPNLLQHPCLLTFTPFSTPLSLFICTTLLYSWLESTYMENVWFSVYWFCTVVLLLCYCCVTISRPITKNVQVKEWNLIHIYKLFFGLKLSVRKTLHHMIKYKGLKEPNKMELVYDWILVGEAKDYRKYRPNWGTVYKLHTATK